MLIIFLGPYFYAVEFGNNYTLYCPSWLYNDQLEIKKILLWMVLEEI